MIVGKEGTFPRSINQRVAEYLAIVNSGFGGFLSIADTVFVSSTTVSSIVGSTGIFTRLSTGAVGTMDGELQYNRQLEPSFHCRFRLSDQTSSRLFIGLTRNSGTEMVNSTLPSGNYAGLYMGAGDTTWKFVHANGGEGTTVNEGTSSDSEIHNFYMWLKKSGGINRVSFQLDNGTRVEAINNLPTTSTMLRLSCAVRGISVTRSLDIAKVTIIQEA